MKRKILFASLLIVGSTVAIWQLKPRNKPTSYLFAHGMAASERQAMKYFQEYQPSTGDRLGITDLDFNVMQEPCTGFNFPEIVFGDKINQSRLIVRFAGWLWALAEGWRASSEKITFKEAVKERTLALQSIDISRINLGQDDDIAALSAAYDAHVAQYPMHDVVIYGVSRGSATAFNFLSTTYQEKELQHVKAVVLESCYASFDHSPKAQWLFSKISSYDPNGIMPIKVVNQFPHDIPVLFITSLNDPRVPASSVRKLYEALKQTGHPDVHLLELQHGTHPNYMFHPEDREQYLSGVHAFYKKYGLAHLRI